MLQVNSEINHQVAKSNTQIDNMDKIKKNRTKKHPKQLVFKISPRNETAHLESRPYLLSLGAVHSRERKIDSPEVAIVVLDNRYLDLKDFPGNWLECLSTRLQKSESEPKLRLVANNLPIGQHHKFEWLTTRENQVLRYRHLGFSAKESAAQLGISHRTVEKQLELVRNKLGLCRISPLYLYSVFNTYKLIENYLDNFAPTIQQGKAQKIGRP